MLIPSCLYCSFCMQYYVNNKKLSRGVPLKTNCSFKRPVKARSSRKQIPSFNDRKQSF